MDRQQKEALVEELGEEIRQSESIFAIDYRGISVSQSAELRGKLREADASFRVVKNRLTKLAAEKAGVAELEPMLDGPTALTFVRGDTATAAKAITTFNREYEVLSYKGGLMGDMLLDEDRFKEIARLPSRDALNAQLAGMVASPIVTLTRGLGSMVQGLAIQLSKIAEQGLVGGDAEPEAAPEDAGAEETAEETSEEPTSDESTGEETGGDEESGEADESAEGDGGEDESPEASAEDGGDEESAGEDGAAEPAEGAGEDGSSDTAEEDSDSTDDDSEGDEESSEGDGEEA
ncbi:MAG: 50S ribosomal protein L10 [Solirubrobacterales bacterium]